MNLIMIKNERKEKTNTAFAVLVQLVEKGHQSVAFFS